MAINKVSRAIDAVQMAEQSDQQTAGTTFDVNDFGFFNNFKFNFSNNQKVIPGIRGGNQGHLNSRIVGLSHKTTGDCSFMPQHLKFLKYCIPDYSEESGEYILANRSSAMPPSLTVRGNVNGTEGLQVTGCHFDNFRFSLTDEDILTVSSNVMGIKPTNIPASVDYTEEDLDPLIYSDGVFTYNGVEMDLSKIDISINPAFAMRYGITSKADGDKRLPTQILRGNKTQISFSGEANVTSSAQNELEVLWGGSSPQDQTQDVTMTLAFTKDSKTHTITLVGQTNNIGLAQSDSEEGPKKITFDGAGTDFTVRGDL